MAAVTESSLSLVYTPTWALATVCFSLVSISILMERSIHFLTKWLKKRRKNAFCGAADRLVSELMLLGFLSLLLALTQDRISKICISQRLAVIMLPCKQVNVQLEWVDDQDLDSNSSTSPATHSCSAMGKVSFISQNGVQQLQRFIFVLAVTQIVYSVLTMALGSAKIRRWNAWEEETQTTAYQVANDPHRFRLTKQTTFWKRHMTPFAETCTLLLWIKCFLRQFFNSVAKVDYLTLRHGFISAHFSGRYSNFNFREYIERSLDQEFKTVVSISPFMWFLVVIFMLVDVRGWHAYLWVSLIPALIVLVTGTKLQVIVSKMALQLQNQNDVVIGTPLVMPNDSHFWFSRPRFVLSLLHVTLFVNAFELAFFIWVLIEFGFDSCYHEHTGIIITRVVLAVSVQVLCSYITLPLYALVTQMGSEFKRSGLNEEMSTVSILNKWVADVRRKRKKQEEEEEILSLNLLQGYNTTFSAAAPPAPPPHSGPAGSTNIQASTST